jgi:rRNA maturation protein Rpf1
VIVLGTTRKPTQRIRSFIKELVRVIPGSTRITRGKQGFAEFCDAAHELGAPRLLLVGAFHGNPGRLGFLTLSEENWAFSPPTIIIKSTQLLRETEASPSRNIKTLVVLPDRHSDQPKAQLLAEALMVSCTTRDDLSSLRKDTVVLRVALSRYKAMDFVSTDETQLLGPSMKIKHFLTRPIGELRRW